MSILTYLKYIKLKEVTSLMFLKDKGMQNEWQNAKEYVGVMTISNINIKFCIQYSVLYEEKPA